MLTMLPPAQLRSIWRRPNSHARARPCRAALLGAEELAAYVDVIVAVELLGGDLQKVKGRSDAGAVHQSVQTAEKFNGLIHHPPTIVHHSQISLDRDCAPAHTPDLFHCLQRACGARRIVDRHVGTSTGQFQCYAPADAGTCTGDKSKFACKTVRLMHGDLTDQ